MIEIPDGDVTWRIEPTFMQSNWTCIWGRGCQGILDEPAEKLNQGCCSVGAEMGDDDEARLIAALAATLSPDRFQHHAQAASQGIFSDDSNDNTRVIDGACIFLNRPGFDGGAGCAFHIEAMHCGESPTDWKPSVCWQLPIKVDWELHDNGTETATVRKWSRADWGSDGDTMAWCCTDEPETYVGDQPVVESLSDELGELLGKRVYLELRSRLG